MTNRKWALGTAALTLGVLILAAPASRAEEKKDEEPRWDHTFKGHEMWSTKVDEAIAQGTKEGRPVLVDLYKLH
jgi:hypothetical protein